jgi:hypothetical protein
MRTDLQFKHEPVIDTDIRDAEFRPYPFFHFDPATVIRGLDFLQVHPKEFNQIIRILILRIAVLRLPIIEQVPDEIAKPRATVRVAPFGLALCGLLVMAMHDGSATEST